MPTKWVNQHRTFRHTYAGKLQGPFSNEQKAAICILAREAWEHQGGLDRGGGERKSRGEAGRAPGSFEVWRRSQQSLAVGKLSLTDCTQEDYKPLQAHFLLLKGEAGKAVKAHIDAETEDNRVALYKLRETLRKHALGEAYAVTIARSRFKETDLAKLTTKQIWNLIFSINNR